MAGNQQNMDWDALGRNIEDIIDRAVNSQNYQKLNQTITQAVEKAIDTGNQSIRKAKEYQQDAYRKKHGYSRPVYTYTPPKNEATTRVPPKNRSVNRVSPKGQINQKLPALYGNATGSTASGIVMTVFGSLISLGSLSGIGVNALVNLLVQEISFSVFPYIGMGIGLIGGVGLLGAGISGLARISRFKTYVKILGQKTYCALDQLAQGVGRNSKFVRKDLLKMIDEGLFIQGYLDEDNNCLITSKETYYHYQQAKLQMAERKRLEQKAAQEEEAKQAARKIDGQVQEVLDRGDAFLKEIRSCNDAIPGQEISDKISHMEMIVKKIFERAEEHPEIVPDLKKLMDYYLPMTVKLLKAYADMDRQPIQGETIQSSKREIEATLDTLNSAFEKLLDSVFRETAMDVSSDISVLQTLLAQEGLTEDDISRHRKDFQ